MNRRLQDQSKDKEEPEVIEEYLDEGHALCVAFNRRGTMLASGTKEGNVVIWDFETRGVAHVLEGHEAPVTGLCWSQNGRYLVSGASDGKVLFWNVVDYEHSDEVHELGAEVLGVSLSARAPYRCAVSLGGGKPPMMLYLEEEDKQSAELPVIEAVASTSSATGTTSGGAVAVLSRCGQLAVVGQQGGLIAVIDANTRQYLDLIRVGSEPILSLQLTRKSDLILIRAADSQLYTCALMAAPEMPQHFNSEQVTAAVAASGNKQGCVSLLHPVPDSAGPAAPCPGSALLTHQSTLQRPMGRACAWSAACISGDGAHVVAAESRAVHVLYVWSRASGQVQKVLEGPAERCIGLAWHPLRGMLLSVSEGGRVYVWAKAYAENWSAFAPGFKELHTNVEYVEREDEFDWATPGAGATDMVSMGGVVQPLPEGQTEDDFVLDVVSRDPTLQRAFSSDEEEDEQQQLHYLPVLVDPEPLPEPADTAAVSGAMTEEELAAAAAAGAMGLQLAGEDGAGVASGLQDIDDLMRDAAQMAGEADGGTRSKRKAVTFNSSQLPELKRQAF